MITALSALAYIFAISLTLSVGTPVIDSTSAYFSTVAFSSSKPVVRFLMNSLSWRSCWMIQYMIELIRAMFVEGL